MNPKMVTTAGLLIAIGFIGLRLNIVIPGLAAEEVNGITHAISSSRLSADYFPSLTEFLLTAGVIGLGLVLFGLGERYLPVENERV
jgi:molybdopterin-containing oxidoreductase family membrane subunit